MRIEEIKGLANQVLGETSSMYSSKEKSKEAKTKLAKFVNNLKRKLKGTWKFEYYFNRDLGFHSYNIYHKKSSEHLKDHMGVLEIEDDKGSTVYLSITKDPGYRHGEFHRNITVDKAAKVLHKYAKRSNP